MMSDPVSQEYLFVDGLDATRASSTTSSGSTSRSKGNGGSSGSSKSDSNTSAALPAHATGTGEHSLALPRALFLTCPASQPLLSLPSAALL